MFAPILRAVLVDARGARRAWACPRGPHPPPFAVEIVQPYEGMGPPRCVGAHLRAQPFLSDLVASLRICNEPHVQLASNADRPTHRQDEQGVNFAMRPRHTTPTRGRADPARPDETARAKLQKHRRSIERIFFVVRTYVRYVRRASCSLLRNLACRSLCLFLWPDQTRKYTRLPCSDA